jgi:CRP-like cAMP-binding protein
VRPRPPGAGLPFPHGGLIHYCVFLASSAVDASTGANLNRTIEATAAIRLLEAEPGIGQFLSPEDFAAARQLIVPTREIPRGSFDESEFLRGSGYFGAIVLEGMVLQRVKVGENTGLRLLGPGDVMSLTNEARSILLSYLDARAIMPTRLAVLGREMMAAVGRWPALVAGLHVRTAEQNDRLLTQLVICQLPRVDQRLLSIMWLLAESWGRVTPSGTSLPIALTHDLLGGLVGARRSTVTLALGELSERGALIRQDGGWLLTEPPPVYSDEAVAVEDPRLLEGGTAWRAEHAEPAADREQLLQTLHELREEHIRRRQEIREQVARIRRARARHDELTLPGAPS